METSEGRSQRSPPRLSPAGLPARVATAIAPPSLDSVRAAPCAPFDDLSLARGRTEFEIFAIVGELCEPALLDIAQRICQRHIAESLVVAVRLAVGRDVHELGRLSVVREGADESASKILAIVQQAIERNPARN